MPLLVDHLVAFSSPRGAPDSPQPKTVLLVDHLGRVLVVAFSSSRSRRRVLAWQPRGPRFECGDRDLCPAGSGPCRGETYWRAVEISLASRGR